MYIIKIPRAFIVHVRLREVNNESYIIYIKLLHGCHPPKTNKKNLLHIELLHLLMN
jgi:hypothetical protein